MKATELRIGNYVNLTKDDFRTIKLYQLDGFDIYKLSESDCIDIEAIPLTEDWLLKFGFQKDNNQSYWINLQTHYFEIMPCNVFYYPSCVQLPEMSSEDEQRVSLNRIEHVHQLQNLYFALTGKELNYEI